MTQNVTLSAVSKQIQVSVDNENEEPVSGEVRVTSTGGGAGLNYVQTLTGGQANFTVNPAGAPYLVNVTNCRGDGGSPHCYSHSHRIICCHAKPWKILMWYATIMLA